MAGFGGAIKLTGAQEYRDALAKITQNVKENASAMQLLATQYDRTDKSEEAMTARARALGDVLATQREKLRVLQEQYAEFASRAQEQAEKHQNLVNQYTAEKQKLEALEQTVGKTSDEYKAQLEVVENLAHEVSKSTTANEANEKSMSNMRIQMNQAQGDINKTTKELNELGNEAEDSGKKAEQSANGGYTVLKNVLANLATKAITSAIEGLKKLGQTFINVGKQAVQSYGQYEQMVGGVYKIFESATQGSAGADAVMENAMKAFKTVGLSANQYMETVTSFSASLIQGLGDDTLKASEFADMAMQDMADNVNAFGTSMESVRSAYAGFAKDNYTMLDNLKLGYGGNATEMARLINESKVLGENVKVTAKTVKDVPFDRIIEAIHITQQRVGILGTTTAEAEHTIQGSTRAMQASWQNLLVGIADDNADFSRLVDDFISTIDDGHGGGAFNQLLPRITTAINGISKALQMLVPTLVQSVAPMITQNLPVIIQAVQDMLTAILNLLPTIMPTIQRLIPQIINSLISNLPLMVETGLQIILALLNGIVDAMPQIINMMPTIILQMVDAILSHAQEILQAGLKLIGMLGLGILQGFNSLSQVLVRLLVAIQNALNPIKDWMINLGRRIVEGIWSGISGAYTWIANKIRGWVGNVVLFIKRLFGIHSPSTLFRDEIGENLALGIGEGFSDEMEDVSRQMADAIPTSFDVSPSVTGARYGSDSGLDMVNAFKEALSQMKIELDDEVAGRFVESTVARAIYA